MNARAIPALVVVMIVSACGSSTTGPSHALVKIAITGPASVAPGATAAFIATGYFSDGTNENDSAGVTWNSNPTILRMATNGVATGIGRGETVIQASRGPISASMNVFVLPPGTFRLTGTVTGPVGPVNEAAVKVTAGIGIGLVTTTDVNGQYRLYGVAGPIQIVVTRAGFATVTQDVTVDSQAVSDVTLTPTGVLIDPGALPGTYSMDVTMGDICEQAVGSMPDAAKARHFVATITLNGTAVQVTLSGASFVLADAQGHLTFMAQVEPEGLTFILGDPYYYTGPPALIEALSATTALMIQGRGTLQLSGTTLTGFLDGFFVESSLPYPGRTIATCYSETHKIVLTRTSTAARVRR